MGLGNSQHAIYLNIVDGKIARRYKVAMEGITKTRQTSTGKLVHEQFFDHVSGYITNIGQKEHKEYGIFLEIEIVDGEERFILQTQIDGGYGRAFLKLLPNVDFSLRTTLIPSMKVEDDKKKVTLFITQKGVSGAVKHFFTFENNKGMPPGNKTRYKGKDVFDYTDQIEFLWKFFETNVRPKMKGSAQKLNNQAQDKPADTRIDKSALTVSDAEMEDDLPF